MVVSNVHKGNKQGVAYTRPELRDRLIDYQLISHCVDGQRKVKSKTTQYLPAPNTEDTSSANTTRYNAYLARAVFYNVTQRTLSGMVGEVFAREPVVEISTALAGMEADATGSGLSLTQLAKRVTRYTLSMGRAGLLADYPATEGELTVARLATGEIQPTLTVYRADCIINWRTSKQQAKTKLTLVVLEETYDDEDDGFSVSREKQTRVLRLRDNVYTVQVYRDGSPYEDEFTPTDNTGRPFDAIPFTFIGSENNDTEIDHPPMLDLAEINAAHYRNSADYEEGVYMTGQPTPVFAGLSQEWVEKVMGGKVHLGSRGGVMLPEGGSAILLQMEANSAAFEAMQHKERQMVALGAKLVETSEVQRTATEANIENTSETSTLADVAKNVGNAIEFGLEMCARFVGDKAKVEYRLNSDFSLARLTAQERQQTISEWQMGALSFSEMRDVLRKGGVATLDNDKAEKEILEDPLMDRMLTDDLGTDDPGATV